MFMYDKAGRRLYESIIPIESSLQDRFLPFFFFVFDMKCISEHPIAKPLLLAAVSQRFV
jgi:hypothetical protein